SPTCEESRCLLYSSYFFFSSRRRHTRSKRDWSSDVCSSDLTPNCSRSISVFAANPMRVWPQGSFSAPRYSVSRVTSWVTPRMVRSEERRVGKECKAWWCGEHYKTNRDRSITVMISDTLSVPG